MEILFNGKLSIEVSAHGAELCSIFSNGKEYLWQADPCILETSFTGALPYRRKCVGKMNIAMKVQPTPLHSMDLPATWSLRSY